MRVVLQRVSEAKCFVKGMITAEIGQGLLILLGIEDSDAEPDIEWLVRKIVQLRVFNDEKGVMNLSLLDTGGDAIVISQFTLHASAKKGNRPSYIRAARPEIAVPLYESFIRILGEFLGKPAGSGIFGAHMDISLTNDGPVTIILDTKNKDF